MQVSNNYPNWISAIIYFILDIYLVFYLFIILFFRLKYIYALHKSLEKALFYILNM